MADDLSERDRKELARLVRKYGRDRIVAEAKWVRRPLRGRPPEPDRWVDVDWIEEHADKYGGIGNATTERFLMNSKRAEQTGDVEEKFAKEIENRRGQFSRVMKALRAKRRAARQAGRYRRRQRQSVKHSRP